MNETFIFSYETGARAKGQIEETAHIKIDATDRGSLEFCFTKLLEADRGGLIRQIMQRALLKSQASVNQN